LGGGGGGGETYGRLSNTTRLQRNDFVRSVGKLKKRKWLNEVWDRR